MGPKLHFFMTTHTLSWPLRFVYCDGNSFTGNRAQPINVNGTDLYWRGWSILNSILADLSVNPLTAKSWLAAEQVMVTGCSAGGLASILHGDYLLASLPSKSVKKQGIVPISGFFLDVPNVDGTPVYGDGPFLSFLVGYFLFVLFN